jgi:GrpB-like predicted nucleotidyltransferase (UPF0157 family)
MIDIVEYDPAWPLLFAQVRDRVWPEIGDIAVTVEHVGSTAVPGLAGKPVIDIDVVIPLHAKVMTMIGRLARLGYIHRGDLGIMDREAFTSPATAPPHHLYVCRRGSVALHNHLALRDHLRRHPDDVAAYAALKRKLAAECADVDQYTRKKTDFILSILSKYDFSEVDLTLIRRQDE